MAMTYTLHSTAPYQHGDSEIPWQNYHQMDYVTEYDEMYPTLYPSGENEGYVKGLKKNMIYYVTRKDKKAAQKIDKIQPDRYLFENGEYWRLNTQREVNWMCNEVVNQYLKVLSISSRLGGDVITQKNVDQFMNDIFCREIAQQIHVCYDEPYAEFGYELVLPKVCYKIKKMAKEVIDRAPTIHPHVTRWRAREGPE